MIRNYIFFLEKKKKKKKEPLGAEQLHRAPPNYEGIHLGEGADKTHRTLEPTNFLSFFLSSFLLLPRALNTERDPRNIFKNIHGRKNPSTAEWRDSALEGIIIKKRKKKHGGSFSGCTGLLMNRKRSAHFRT